MPPGPSGRQPQLAFGLLLTAVLGCQPAVRSAAARSPAALTTGTRATAAAPRAPTPIALTVVHPVANGLTVDGVTKLCDDNLALARRMLGQIRAVDAAHGDWRHTMGQLDNVLLSINNASEFPYLMGVAHPDEAVRNAARACESKTDKLLTSIYLDPDLARVVKRFAAHPGQLSPERTRFLHDTLRDFHRNGIDLAGDDQQRLRAINEEITRLGQRFIAEISASKGEILVRPDQLVGLPDAYRKRHPVGADGKVHISTDYPDYYPFVTYANDRHAAKSLYIAFVNRGGDANVARLDRLLALRHEKAKLLGYPSWADYAIEPRMAKRAREVRAFIERVHTAIGPAIKTELKAFREEWQRTAGHGQGALIPPDRYYLTDRLRARRFHLDSQALAKYFEIERVTKGLLDITARMYGLEYRRVPAHAWHPSVQAYEVWSHGRQVGKFYLDLFPRDDKYKHAAMFTIRTGKTLASGQRQTPIAALVCNFPHPGEPMPHDQVVTYFHEFGHVLHHLLSETELARYSGTSTVRDFVEAPSQMFEQWAWSREVLDLFARSPDRGDKIPTELFGAMTQARHFGLALQVERQLYLAMLDLAYHTRKPPFDTTRVLQEVQGQTFSFAYVEGTHFQSSFGHLIGYDAAYYGYQWALALAHDAFSRFRQSGLLDPATADAWRRLVLARGGAGDERSMIAQFLGRQPNEKAYVEFLRMGQ